MGLIDCHHAWRHVGHAGKGKTGKQDATLPSQRFLCGLLSVCIGTTLCHDCILEL